MTRWLSEEKQKLNETQRFPSWRTRNRLRWRLKRNMIFILKFEGPVVGRGEATRQMGETKSLVGEGWKFISRIQKAKCFREMVNINCKFSNVQNKKKKQEEAAKKKVV